jgi:hypothetical protein
MVSMNGDDNDTITILQKRIQAYADLKIRVHITLKSGLWKRGIITKVGDEFFMLEESLQGEMPIFFQEIEKIDKYFDKREGEHDK